jgi:hypothetical protein
MSQRRQKIFCLIFTFVFLILSMGVGHSHLILLHFHHGAILEVTEVSKCLGLVDKTVVLESSSTWAPKSASYLIHVSTNEIIIIIQWPRLKSLIDEIWHIDPDCRNSMTLTLPRSVFDFRFRCLKAITLFWQVVLDESVISEFHIFIQSSLDLSYSVFNSIPIVREVRVFGLVRKLIFMQVLQPSQRWFPTLCAKSSFCIIHFCTFSMLGWDLDIKSWPLRVLEFHFGQHHVKRSFPFLVDRNLAIIILFVLVWDSLLH